MFASKIRLQIRGPLAEKALQMGALVFLKAFIWGIRTGDKGVFYADRFFLSIKYLLTVWVE